MKKVIGTVVSLILVAVVFCSLFLETIAPGRVGVVYSIKGVEDKTLSQGWKILPPWKSVKQFPISEQQLVFSNSPADYNSKEHQDWSIDAPANGGMVKLNMTINYAFIEDKVVDLYKRFNGMDGETLVERMIQNSIIAYIKEVTPQFTVMEIYSDKRAEVRDAITAYLNLCLEEEYGIRIERASIIDVQLDNALMEKIKAKEQAKQEAENAEYEKQTALAQAETNKVKAQSEADIKIISAQAEADANRIITESLTPELIQKMEAEARMKHGWVTTITQSAMIDATQSTQANADATQSTQDNAN